MFVERTGIGVVSTFMAKGCVDMDDEACLFTIGLQARDHPVRAIERSDLVITLGYDMVEYHPRLWNAASACCLTSISPVTSNKVPPHTTWLTP